MKLFFTMRRRGKVAAPIAFLVAFSVMAGPGFSATTPAPTNAPAAAPPAPAGEIDKETGKPVVTTPTGLKYVDIVVGTGPEAKTGDSLVVSYEGRLIDGTKFDSSYDRGHPFSLVLGVSAVIKGWTEGLAGMKAGGKRKLIIPPPLGYGQEGFQDVIPPNATLIFNVELVSINAK